MGRERREWRTSRVLNGEGKKEEGLDVQFFPFNSRGRTGLAWAGIMGVGPALVG